MLNLIPEGNIPRDGNCMYHAVAQSIQRIQGRNYTQQEIRNFTCEWLRTNPILSNGVNLEDFLHNVSWEEYLQGVGGSEWGDHIALIGISNAFGVNIAVVSSEDFDIHIINPQNQILTQIKQYILAMSSNHIIFRGDTIVRQWNSWPNINPVKDKRNLTTINLSIHLEGRSQLYHTAECFPWWRPMQDGLINDNGRPLGLVAWAGRSPHVPHAPTH